MDTISKEQRSALMKKVKQSGTRPELMVRKELHRRGLRYVITDRRLPGTPDLSFPRYKAAVFVHGCFWHGHHCRMGRSPSSNVEFWRPKIRANRLRDKRKKAQLMALGWRVFIVWECMLRPAHGVALYDDLAAEIRAIGENHEE